MKAKAAAATALWTALVLCEHGARAADLASDTGSHYHNPWGPANPQDQPNSGFAQWVFDEFLPPSVPFFIDTIRGAWGINGTVGYDAAWTSFTGDGQLDSGQTFSTTVLFTLPGNNSAATEAVDFFAQDPSLPSHYDTFGHQVLGIYLSSASSFVLLVHTGQAPSDENPSVIQTLPLPFTGTASSPQKVKITYTQFLAGNWLITIRSGGTALALTSFEFGATWNRQGVDAVRYFTSRGGANPLEWKNRSVRSGFPF